MHKFQVGTSVTYDGGKMTPGARSTYKVIQQLPVERDNRIVYRIKSVAESFDAPPRSTSSRAAIERVGTHPPRSSPRKRRPSFSLSFRGARKSARTRNPEQHIEISP